MAPPEYEPRGQPPIARVASPWLRSYVAICIIVVVVGVIWWWL